MAQGQSQITVIGNVGGDPELRFTPSGAAVCNFNIGQTPRFFDKQANEWKDGETQWFRCAVWRTMAENVAESIQKGDRVIVTGTLAMRKYEKQDGGTGLSVEINVDEVGHSLRFGTTRFNRGQRTQGQQQGQQQSNDPWAGASEPPYSDDPPF